MTAPEFARLTDAQLIQLALQKDEQLSPRAYDELYRRYKTPVTAKARTLVDDPDMLKSVVNRTFTKAFDKLDRFDPKRKLEPWLGTICQNAARDRLRQEKKLRQTMRHSVNWLLEVSNPPDPSAYAHLKVTDARRTPDEGAVWGNYVDRLFCAVERLKPNHRETILLLIEDLSYEQIAERLGIPENTVASRVSRAKEALKAKWEEMYGLEDSGPHL